MDIFPSPDDVDSVTSLFPGVSPVIVRQNLKRTNSVELTINKILDGQLDSDSDEELPDVSHFIHNPLKTTRTCSPVNPTQNYSKFALCKEQIPDSSVCSVSSSVGIPADPSVSSGESETVRYESPKKRMKTSGPCNISDEMNEGEGSHKHFINSKAGICVSDHSDVEDAKENSGLITFSTTDYLLQSNFSTATDRQVGVHPSRNELGSSDGNSTSVCGANRKRVKGGQSKKADDKDVLEKKKQKEEEKAARAREREAKKQAKAVKDLEAAKKRALMEARKHSKPGECMKLMTMIIDPSIIKYPCGAAILTAVQSTDMKFEVQPQPLANIITFWREVTEVKEVDGKLETNTHEVVEDQVIFWLPVEDFVSLVHAFQQSKTGLIASGVPTLRSHVKAIRQSLENRPVTLLVQGLDKYFKGHNIGRGRGRGKKTTPTVGSPHTVSRLEVEEALVDLQLHTHTNICFAESDQDVAQSIMQYAKAVAETPFKRDRLNTAFNFHVETSGTVRIEKDGRGLAKLWRQQIQQFRLVSAEVANAIIASYPTPKLLFEAYQRCSQKEAEQLLQDIVVRRGYGVMETTRRVGPELSKKMYSLMTSINPNTIIK